MRFNQMLIVCCGLLICARDTSAQVLEFTDKATFESALPTPTVIDFDGLPTSGVMTGNEYLALGVRITQLQDGALNVLSSPPAETFLELVWGSLPNGISSSYASTPRPDYVAGCCQVYFNNGNSDDIRFTFAARASGAGIYIGENDHAGETVRFLDSANNVIYSKYFPPFSPGHGFYGITSSTPIAAMEVLNAAFDGDGIFYDDLVFQPLCPGPGTDTDGDGVADACDACPGTPPGATVDATGCPVQCTMPPPGMVAWWPGDGNAHDIQGGHDGTLLNGATFATGKVGQAFSLDGEDDQVSVPDAPDLRFGSAGPITVDLWAYRTGTGPVMHLVGKRAGCSSNISYQMAVNNTTDDLSFGGTYGGVGTHRDLPLNTWMHLAGSFDGTMYRFYINGELAESAPAPGLGLDLSDPLLIGGSGGCARFQGLIDEVEIFNRALGDSEIRAIFNAGSSGKCKVADSDGDGVPDDADNCPTVPNVNQSDADGDGRGDACDNCPSAPNPTQTNADGDAFGAACECNDANSVVYPGAPQICDGLNDDCSDPLWPAVPANEHDIDGDQIPACADNCPLTANANQADSGGSACGDVCDPAPATVKFTPQTLNKQSQGQYVKVHIKLGPNHTAATIDASQTMLLSVAGGAPIPDAQRQIGGNEIDVSFDRQEVADEAPLGESVEFRLTGALTYGCAFEGVDNVRVIQEGKVHTSEGDASSIVDDAPRGDVDNMRVNGNGDMGPAICLGNYVSNYEFSSNTDPENPPRGKAFFYLFKFCNGGPNCSYGQTSGGQERTISSGGCP